MAELTGREENYSAGGGGGATRRPIFPTPPLPLLGRRDGRGGSGRGCPTCRAGGGGVNPTSMAQNDTHVALIILTTQMWGGGIIGGKNFFGPQFVLLRLQRQHPFLHKTKGPARNPISPTPPPLPRRAPPPPPPPPPQSNFQVTLGTSDAICQTERQEKRGRGPGLPLPLLSIRLYFLSLRILCPAPHVDVWSGSPALLWGWANVCWCPWKPHRSCSSPLPCCTASPDVWMSLWAGVALPRKRVHRGLQRQSAHSRVSRAGSEHPGG